MFLHHFKWFLLNPSTSQKKNVAEKHLQKSIYKKATLTVKQNPLI